MFCPEFELNSETKHAGTNETEEAMEGAHQHLNSSSSNSDVKDEIKNGLYTKTGDFIFENREFNNHDKEQTAADSQTIAIPNAHEIKSSPEISFGQDTLNMVDEFMKNEAIAQTNTKKRNVVGEILRRLFCC
ncbi:uncharacterized protein VICG_01869 [Vittaforma corneae ATCC 50505]|uniref:Uncharacterized protein n=1 Tax=Vittaforma corneae (strain ATCC 50505) TaxID=993615 RepID=L2GJP3_VITCO|nr:uncharacterized protein VICG_01869 [Vittaforma corneae ATCC 50505]ELA41076.1 hypothetical protein VICG_01869 [Vittaforma corneae ATCC 50505]